MKTTKTLYHHLKILFLFMVMITACDRIAEPEEKPEKTQALTGKTWRMISANLFEKDMASNLCVTANGSETCDESLKTIREFEVNYNDPDGDPIVVTGTESFYLPWRTGFYNRPELSYDMAEEVVFNEDGTGRSSIYHGEPGICINGPFTWNWTNTSFDQVEIQLSFSLFATQGFFSFPGFVISGLRQFPDPVNFLQTTQTIFYADYFYDPFAQGAAPTVASGDLQVEFADNQMILKQHFYHDEQSTSNYRLESTGNDDIEFVNPRMIKEWILEIRFTEVEATFCPDEQSCGEPLECSNGGVFNNETCRCDCPEGFTGEYCEQAE